MNKILININTTCIDIYFLLWYYFFSFFKILCDNILSEMEDLCNLKNGKVLMMAFGKVKLM